VARSCLQRTELRIESEQKMYLRTDTRARSPCRLKNYIPNRGVATSRPDSVATRRADNVVTSRPERLPVDNVAPVIVDSCRGAPVRNAPTRSSFGGRSAREGANALVKFMSEVAVSQSYPLQEVNSGNKGFRPIGSPTPCRNKSETGGTWQEPVKVHHYV